MKFFKYSFFIHLVLVGITPESVRADSPLISDYKLNQSLDQIVSVLRGQWRLKQYEQAAGFYKQEEKPKSLEGEFILAFSTTSIVISEQNSSWPANLIFKNFHSPWSEFANESTDSKVQQSPLNEKVGSSIKIKTRQSKPSQMIDLDFNTDIRRVWSRGSNVGDGRKTIKYLSRDRLTLTGNLQIFLPNSSLSLPYDTITFEKITDKRSDFPIIPEPSINGIALGSSDADVLKAMGKPLKIKKHPGYPAATTFNYQGLTFELTAGKSPKNMSVSRIIIKEAQWTMTPGIKIGQTHENVWKVLGKPYSPLSDDHTLDPKWAESMKALGMTPLDIDFETWDISVEHFLKIYFHDGIVTKIELTKSES